jgi:hypothetical protein
MENAEYGEVLHSIFVTAPRCPRVFAKNDAKEGANLKSCSVKATVPCPKCYLVVYCSDECRRAAWSSHKSECGTCNRLFPAKNDPNNNYDQCSEFWGGYAATDVLNLAQNEGPQFSGRLRILLTGGPAKLPDECKTTNH